jgi:hypothetical protein
MCGQRRASVVYFEEAPMTPKTTILLAVSIAALSIPAAASAQGQPYAGQQYGQPQYGQGSYGQPRGDWHQRRQSRYGSYPEFRPIEMHIRQKIQDGVRDDMIASDDARDLMGQLRQIQSQEMREFRVHGWNLPEADRMRIHSQLDQLDQLVDQTRAEP